MRSTNGGTSFTPIRSGLANGGVNVLAINRQNPAIALCRHPERRVRDHQCRHGVDRGEQRARADHGGRTRRRPGDADDDLRRDHAFGTVQERDGGNTWAAINNGVGSTGNLACSLPSITSLAIDPAAPTTLYAGTHCTLSSQVLKSVNGGATWTPCGTGIPAFIGVNCAGHRSAGDEHSLRGHYAPPACYRAPTAARTGVPVTGIAAGFPVTGVSIAVIPESAGGGSALAVSTAGNGAFISTDGGVTFQAATTGAAQAISRDGTRGIRPQGTIVIPCENLVQAVVVGWLTGLIRCDRVLRLNLAGRGSGGIDGSMALQQSPK